MFSSFVTKDCLALMPREDFEAKLEKTYGQERVLSQADALTEMLSISMILLQLMEGGVYGDPGAPAVAPQQRGREQGNATTQLL